MLRGKRRSQLSRNRAPVRPYVLHTLPHGYGEGDLNAIADGGHLIDRSMVLARLFRQLALLTQLFAQLTDYLPRFSQFLLGSFPRQAFPTSVPQDLPGVRVL